MNRLKKLAAEPWQTVLDEEEELKSDQPFWREPDVIVSDIDPYYFILFLEYEFGKNLGGKFKRPDGSTYNDGYIKTVKSGNKGVTADFLAAVKEFIPNFEQEYKQFLDFTLSKSNGQEVNPEEVERLKALVDDSTQPQSSYAKFLVQVTGLNVAQLQDAMGGIDPNSTYVAEDGKTKIHKDLLKIVYNTFGLKPDDFKEYKNNNGYTTNTNKINELQKYYNSIVANSNNKLRKLTIKALV